MNTEDRKPVKRPSGFKRDDDGMLVWVGGIGTSYGDPQEAIKTYWAGDTRPGCNHAVFAMYNYHPCGKSPKHDPDSNGRPTKCGQHSAAAMARREAKRDATTARWKREMAARDALNTATRRVEEALRQIAGGHNDPRTLAQETLSNLDAARAELAEGKE